jgi:hypothetical protein
MLIGSLISSMVHRTQRNAAVTPSTLHVPAARPRIHTGLDEYETHTGFKD